VAECAAAWKHSGVTVAPDVQAAAQLGGIIAHADHGNSGKPSGRKRTGDAKRKEKKDIDRVAKENNIDADKFGSFVEVMKEGSGLPSNFQYTNAQLGELAHEFKAGFGK
jgi:hypothetical protein